MPNLLHAPDHPTTPDDAHDAALTAAGVQFDDVDTGEK